MKYTFEKLKYLMMSTASETIFGASCLKHADQRFFGLIVLREVSSFALYFRRKLDLGSLEKSVLDETNRMISLILQNILYGIQIGLLLENILSIIIVFEL